MADLARDLRFAVRMLRKSPLVTGAAVLSLALGIGANTTAFTLLNALFLRGLPVENPATLMAVFTTEERQQQLPFFGANSPVSRPNYLDLRERNNVFSDLADSFIFVGADLAAEGGEPEQVTGEVATTNYFTVLGIRPHLGRLFTDEGNDEVIGSEPVVVLSHRFWSRRFGADPDVLGRTLRLNNHPFTVIGVTPPGFNGVFTLGSPDFWAPVSNRRVFLTGVMARFAEDRRALLTSVFGRLKPGVTEAQADAAVQTLGTALREEFPVPNKNRSFTVMPLETAALGPGIRDGIASGVGLLMTLVGFVLLIACANVANLLLGRAAARRREIGVRLALGAPRADLVRQLLTESVVLALLAGGVGLLVAQVSRDVLWATRPAFLQQSALDLGFDPAVLVFTVVVTILTGLLFGLVPALRFSRLSLVEELNQASDSVAGAGRLWSFRNALVMTQVTLSLVALVGSGLFLRSLAAATEIDLGLDADRLATMTFDLARAGYDAERGEAFWGRVVERARGVPGVESASLTTVVPLTFGGFQRTVIVDGRDEDAANNRQLTPVSTVDVDLFKTLGIELRKGRDIATNDRARAEPVVVINQAAADFFWPGEDALERRFQFYGDDFQFKVAGIVETSKYATIGEDPQPQIYIPRWQNYQPAMSLVVRAAGDPGQILGTVRAEIQALDANLAITNVQTGEGLVEQGLWNARMGAGFLGVLGGLALFLAAVGIYGVMAYTVGQRGREISVRVALGADKPAVIRLILAQGMKVVGVGLVLGLGVAAAGSRMLGGMLYGVSALDPVTFALTLGVLVLVALGANLFPALRATSVDPAAVLRFER